MTDPSVPKHIREHFEHYENQKNNVYQHMKDILSNSSITTDEYESIQECIRQLRKADSLSKLFLCAFLIPWYKQPFNWVILITLFVLALIGILNIGLIVFT